MQLSASVLHEQKSAPTASAPIQDLIAMLGFLRLEIPPTLACADVPEPEKNRLREAVAALCASVGEPDRESLVHLARQLQSESEN